MSVIHGISGGAGQHFRYIVDLANSDAMQRRLRYHLLRLTLAGLTNDDIDDFVELGRLVFAESDATPRTSLIKERSAENSLAYAIADIVSEAGRFGMHPRTVLLGAVLGAYLSLRDIPDEERLSVAVLGAIAGATAAAASEVILADLGKDAPPDYFERED